VAADPSLIGTTQDVCSSVDDIDMVAKGHIDRDVAGGRAAGQRPRTGWLDALDQKGDGEDPIQQGLLQNAIPANPSSAGIGGAVAGSF